MWATKLSLERVFGTGVENVTNSFFLADLDGMVVYDFYAIFHVKSETENAVFKIGFLGPPLVWLKSHDEVVRFRD